MAKLLVRIEHDDAFFLNQRIIDRPALFDEMSRIAGKWSTKLERELTGEDSNAKVDTDR